MHHSVTPCSERAPSATAIRDSLVEAYDDDELLFFDPPSLDVAIVGVAARINFGPVVVYDRDKLIAAFVEDGLSEEDAEEWVSFNVEGAYVGERTPIILCSMREILGGAV